MVREATIEDIPRIAEIHVCSWRHAYRGIVSDYELFQQRSVVKAIQKLEKQIQGKDKLLVFEDEKDKIVKGFITYGYCRDDDKQDSYEVYALYVQPEFIKQGIGSALINAVKKRAQELGIKEILLWVLKNNSFGTKFYRKHGFIEDGTQKIIIEWKEKQLRMALQIKQL